MYINAKYLAKTITGVERYALEISLSIQKMYKEITFLMPKKSAINTAYNLEELNLLQFGYFSNYLWEQLELPKFLRKQNNPLLLNLTNTAPIFYSNQIVVIHDVAFLHNPKWYTRKAAWFFSSIVSKSALASKKIITVSEYSKNEIIKYLKIHPDKVSVIYPGVPSGILKFSQKNYSNEFGEYILTVSSLEPRKNIISLIKAFIKLNRPELKLIIVGEKNSLVFRNNNLDLANNKSIIFLGYVDDDMLVRLYKNARLFVYLSLYEGFGFPPVEAISLGCPALVSNTSSMPEVCGDFAEYTDPLNINEISSKIERMLSKNLRIDNKKAEEFIQKYNWQSTAEKFLNVINDVE